jgi:hypothetical protein
VLQLLSAITCIRLPASSLVYCFTLRVGELVRFYREFLANTPDELDTTLGFLNSPDGVPLVGIIVVYAGAIEEGEHLLEPLRRFGPPAADLIRAMPYTEAERLVDDAVPIGHRYYWKSNFVPKLDSAFIDVLRDGADAMPSLRLMILVFEIKGAIGFKCIASDQGYRMAA